MRAKLMPEIKAPDTGLGQEKQAKGINSLLKLRKGILKDIESGNANGQSVMNSLLKAGIQDESTVGALLSDTLDDKVINFLLSKTNNNPAKAMKLSDKFGYRI